MDEQLKHLAGLVSARSESEILVARWSSDGAFVVVVDDDIAGCPKTIYALGAVERAVEVASVVKRPVLPVPKMVMVKKSKGKKD